MAKGIPESDRLLMAQRAQAEMERLAGQLREIISVQPSKDLLGYMYGQRTLRALHSIEDKVGPDDAINSDVRFG